MARFERTLKTRLLLWAIALAPLGAVPARAQEIVRITIRPALAELGIEEVILLSAEATYSNNTVANISELVEWESSNTGVARVSNTAGSKGKLTARGGGFASITVTDPVSGVTSAQSGGDCQVHVLGRLTALKVTPPDRKIGLGEARSMRATGTFNSGVERDVTEQVSWVSSNPAVARVSNEPGSRGRVTALAPGTTMISVSSVTGINSTASGGDARVRVPAKLVSIRIVPGVNRVPIGFTVELDAEGTFDDGSKDDVTSDLMWTSSAPLVASVSDVAGSKGEVTTLQNGTALISAVDPATGLSSTASGFDALVTVAGRLTALAVTPVEESLPIGSTRNFSVRATLDDNSAFNLSRRDVLWTSSDPAVATVGNDRTTAGVVTAVGVGTATISALHVSTGIRSTDSDRDGTISVFSRLVAVEVRPRTRELFVGQTQRFSAFGLLEGGGEVRLSRDVVFTSSDSSIAVVSSESGKRGDTTGMSRGRATISVVHTPSGLSSTDSGGNGTAIVRGAVDALRVEPPRAFYVVGSEPKLRARATFDDGSSDNIGSDCVWTSSDASIATIGNESPKRGVLTAKAVGTVTISALEPTSGVSTSASGGDGIVTIVDGLIRLRVQDQEGDDTLRTGDSRLLEALGTYPNPVPLPGERDRVEVELTGTVNWTSSDPNVIRIEGDRLIAVGLGEASVSATDQRSGLTSTASDGDAKFKVVAALQTIRIKPPRIRTRVGATRRQGFRAIGRYTDGARLELTARVEFETSDPAIARVSNERDRHGLVVPVKPGIANVSAREPITGVQSTQNARVFVRRPRPGRGP